MQQQHDGGDRKVTERQKRRNQQFQNAVENFRSKQAPERLQPKKHRWVTPLVLLLSVGIGLVLIFQMPSMFGEEQLSFVEVFSSVKPQNVLLAVGALAAILLLDVCKYVVTLHATTRTLRPLVSVKTSLLGRYYDNITPFASGGQPMQIYYLYTKGYSAGLSSAVVMIKYFFNTTAWLAVAFVAMVCNKQVLSPVSNGNVLLIAGWTGWALNMCVPVFMVLFVAMPKLAKRITAWIIHVGFKLKIVKNKEAAMHRALSAVRDFRSSFVIMAKRPLHLVLLTLCCVLELSLSFAFPYFIIRMFNGLQTDAGFATMFQVMALHAFASFAASVVPTPGNSGALEGLITTAFSSIAGATLMWVIFTWRFSVYYIYILIGVGITAFNLVRNVVRSRRAKKKSAQAQSASPPPSADEEAADGVGQTATEREQAAPTQESE